MTDINEQYLEAGVMPGHLEKKTQTEELRMRLARVLHKTIRQFEVEKCPEAFDMRVHIDQILKACKEAGLVFEIDEGEELYEADVIRYEEIEIE